MGTNFYWARKVMCNEDGDAVTSNDPDADAHIGKRSAAGAYCWDCGVTLCKGKVHFEDAFHDTCPGCGKGRTKETLRESAAGLELGFAEPRKEKPAGVRSASSFSYAQAPELVTARLVRGWHVEDEYGRRLTAAEFRAQVLDQCPITFTDMVGQEFS